MKIREMLEKVESSKEFKEYKDENKDAYIAHFFCMKDNSEENWQLGYYSKKQDKITVFEINPVKRLPAEEVFKKEENAVKPLIISNLKIQPDKALEIKNKVVAENYSAEQITKTIILLQHLDTQLYNLTLVTQSLSLIHMKIDASNGEVLMHEKKSIMSLRAD